MTTIDASPATARPQEAARGARDVVVIGAGQAGLATAYHLGRAGIDAEVLERAQQVGISWARRWDSLRLFTPARYDALPGLRFPGGPWSHPGKDDVAAYLADYARHLALPVRTGAGVVALRGGPDRFTIHLAGGETVRARRVVVATGSALLGYVSRDAERLVDRLMTARDPGACGEDVPASHAPATVES